ncbi:MAG: hypothetical protein KIT33_13015 [Candidatus Kapabacteria bacterium]|nr:hypothetical protein [Ignavibacteriota bacterium]MCW5885883.1 hypothetical protein [Candidatus Kapabacteria bacterium]
MSNPGQWNVSEKVSQCVFPRLDTDRFFEDADYNAYICRLVDKNIGGFCIFNGNPEQVEQMIHKLQARTVTPLLMSADFENGLPMRLTEGTDFPHALGMGKLSHESVFKIAQAIAKEASGLGIRWNLAPVADVNTNPDNPVINIRSLGEDAEQVAQHVKSYIEGTQVEKVLACAKHFPGHGDTGKDSHFELPTVIHKLDRLSFIEFEPFREAIKTNVASIMLGHLSVPAIDDSGIPASLSPKVVSILREDLLFRGLIVTDALDMKAITNHYSSEKAAFLALAAGCDIALMPENPESVIKFITKLAEDDVEFHEKVDIAARRIILYKRKFGLIPQYQLLEEGKNLYINHAKMALNYSYEILEKSGVNELIPIPENISFAGFAFVKNDKAFRTASRFFTMLAQATENDCDFAYINTEIGDDEIKEMQKGIKDTGIIIFALFYRGLSAEERDFEMAELNRVMDKIATGKKRIVILFGNPYIKNYLNYDLIVLAYSDSFSSLAASVVMLTGREESLKF